MANHVTLAEAHIILGIGGSRSHIYRKANEGLLTLGRRGTITTVDLDELRALNASIQSKPRTTAISMRQECEAYRDGIALLLSFTRRVADYSSDDVLSREAKALAMQAEALVTRSATPSAQERPEPRL